MSKARKEKGYMANCKRKDGKGKQEKGEGPMLMISHELSTTCTPIVKERMERGSKRKEKGQRAHSKNLCSTRKGLAEHGNERKEGEISKR